MLNARLATHYGIPGVRGEWIRAVKLPADSPRGGVLTQASVLKVTANGTFTSPVLRGTWVLENILGTPPSPPPPDVGAIEPDTRGATTIREQLEKHRHVSSCNACHKKIDPPGFALESFDTTGKWRTYYRIKKEGEKLTPEEVAEINPHASFVKFRKGPAVESHYEMPDGTPFTDINEFKAILMKHPEPVVRCITQKLMTFALGRELGFSDRPSVNTIVANIAKEDYGLRSLIHEIVRNEAFVKK